MTAECVIRLVTIVAVCRPQIRILRETLRRFHPCLTILSARRCNSFYFAPLSLSFRWHPHPRTLWGCITGLARKSARAPSALYSRGQICSITNKSRSNSYVLPIMLAYGCRRQLKYDRNRERATHHSYEMSTGHTKSSLDAVSLQPIPNHAITDIE